MERALLVAGAFLLVLGPALQARVEMRQYRELLAALDDYNLPSLTREYLRLNWQSMLPRNLLWPPAAFRQTMAAFDSTRRYGIALEAFSKAVAGHDPKAVQVRMQLVRARNWMIVVLGSMLILAASVIDLMKMLLS